MNSPNPEDPIPPSADRLSPKDEWAWHRRTLETLRARLLDEEHDLQAGTEGLLVPEPADFAEQANSRNERVILEAELRTEQDILEQVEAALDRLREGSYGICVVTGLPIEAARLRALPWTPYSLEAAARRERKK